MRRTQLYLEDDLWKTLHVEAARTGTTVSDLARQALRQKYSDPATSRKAAMEAVVGIWTDRADVGPTERYIRQLRQGSRRRQMPGR